MNWESILVIVVGALMGTDILMRLLFPAFRRVDNAKARKEEISADNDKYKQYEERISDLHNTLDRLNIQIDHYIERDIAKEERFDNQTMKLRDTQRELLEATRENTKLTRRIGELVVEIEKKRCDDMPCPYRLPPNAYSQPLPEMSKTDYIKQSRK